MRNCLLLLTTVLLFFAPLGNVIAQTPGQIFQDAPNDVNDILDPNNDGFISASGGAFVADEDFEYPFIPIPQVDFEDNGDSQGGPCGDTDIVDNPSTLSEASYVYYLDPDGTPDNGDEVLIYRMRIGDDAAGAFGFSVLIDTDAAIGTDDGNNITGNPGFEFEVRYVTGGAGAGVYVYDVDGSVTANSTVSSYAEDANSQRSYALFNDADCSNDVTFYDFWIPLADLGVTSGGQIRLAAATSQSPGNTVLDERGSDVAGVDDPSYPTQDDAYIAIINNQNPTPIGNLGDDGCFIEGVSDAPVVNTPILESATSITGTSTEPDGAFVYLLINDVAYDTVLVSGGAYAFTLTQGDLVVFDELTISVQDSCEYESAAVIAYAQSDGDSDNDGIPDITEGGGVDPGSDADGDGIANYEDPSYPGFTDSNGDGINDNFDTDLDGIPDHFDLDSDNDGISDLAEAGGAALDADNDGRIDNTTDADNDGVLDVVDADQGGTALTITDTDGDGINDAQDLDADGDGLYDIIEAGGTDSDNDGQVDSFTDSDGDGLNDALSGAPLANPDSDSDGNPDSKDVDSDGDGIPDLYEIQTTAGFIAPTGTDTDGDGIDNAYDADNGGTPLSPVDTDIDGTDDYLDADSDNDGVPDSTEGNDGNSNGVADASPTGSDSDGDGLDDAFDSATPGSSNSAGSNIALQDTDGDGIPDYRDTDDDGDGTVTGDGTAGSGEDANGNGDWSDDFTEGGGIYPDYLYNPDFDGDGILDINDLDSDNDGTPDADEDGGTGFDPTGDADGDGILNYLDDNDVTAGFPAFTDANGDGINDVYDLDLDGVPDFHDRDADGDGISDLIEVGGTDNDGDGVLDSFTDANMNGIDDTIEASPFAVVDTDLDGIEDRNDADSDGDGIPDIIEAQTTAGFISLTGSDSDGDGIDDAFDPDSGGTAITSLSLVDTDTDGTPDFQDLDSDGDGVPDLIEGNDANEDGIADVTPAGADADGDGIDDNFDTNSGLGGSNVESSNVALQDTDGDGALNYRDTDDDGDGTITGDGTAGSGEDANGNGDWSDDFTQAGSSVPDYLFNADFDGDGVNDDVDLDSDNDGIIDANEDGGTGFDPTADADGDGTPNYLDQSDVTAGFPAFVDANGDNINDVYDSDLDGLPDFRDLDSDNDGTTDIIEAGGTDVNGDGQVDFFTDGNSDGVDDTIGTSGLAAPDTDGDGVSDLYDLDSDNDGIPDIIETGGTDSDGDGRIDSFTDTDGDGIADIYDPDNGGSAPAENDADGDGLSDRNDLDSDGDGLPDLVEAGGTDADNDGRLDSFADADGDGLADAIDSDSGGTALSNPDTDGDGLPNFRDADADGDGIPDNTELQSTAGYIAPSGSDTDGDGIDDSYDPDNGGTAITNPVDSNGDGVDDYVDTDADGDGISDLIESNDADQNGVADSSPSGSDTDGDGIDDAFDPDNGGSTPGLQDFDGDTQPDYRDSDDDDDGIFTIEEPLDVNPNNGTPDYLEDNVGSCGLGFITTDVDGNADVLVANSGVTSPSNALGTQDDVIADFDNNNDQMVLDLTDTIPQGTLIILRYRRSSGSSGTASMIVASSVDDGVYFDVQSYSTSSSAFTDNTYTVLQSTGIRYLYFIRTSTSRDIGLDGVSYSFTTCDPDNDNDGVADEFDNDDDNDGIPDLTEAGGVDPSADADGDGVANFEDADFAGYVDVNGDGINDNFDFDLDGVPNHFDRDSDNDGISDAVEANGGTLPDPANMTSDGVFTLSFMTNPANDVDGDGLADILDPTNGGTELTPVDSDIDGADDYLDTDSDNDGFPDSSEGFDDSGNGYSIDDLILRAANYEAVNGNPGVYTTTDSDLDGIPDWLEDNDGDGIYNFLDPGFPSYADDDGDGLVNLFDLNSNGLAASVPDNNTNLTPDYIESAVNIPLPVELINFLGSYQEGLVYLQWSTASELNSEAFVIEHAGASLEFNPVGRVEAAGFSIVTRAYNFTHDGPNQGINYYRLRIEDQDGSAEYSPVILVNTDALALSMQVYPNPLYSNETLHIRTAIAADQIRRLSLHTTTGQQLQQFDQEDWQEEIGGISINKINTAKGVYLLKVQLRNGQQHTMKLIVR